MIRSSWSVAVLAASALMAAAPASAATCDGVTFADSVQGPGGALALNGLGLRKATILKVKVYVAGLYLPEKSGDGDAILKEGGAWRLELRFVHDVDASDMEDAFKEGFAKTGADLAPLKDRIDALVGMFVDFKDGQALAFTNDPAKGVAVELDGASKGVIDGADFGPVLLAIWLGAEPPNKDLKSGLLGGACE